MPQHEHCHDLAHMSRARGRPFGHGQAGRVRPARMGQRSWLTMCCSNSGSASVCRVWESKVAFSGCHRVLGLQQETGGPPLAAWRTPAHRGRAGGCHGTHSGTALAPQPAMGCYFPPSSTLQPPPGSWPGLRPTKSSPAGQNPPSSCLSTAPAAACCQCRAGRW